MDIESLRTALIITLSVVLVILLARRIRDRIMRVDLPVVPHTELLSLEVAYHPARLRVMINVPGPRSIRTCLLDARHERIHEWEEEPFDAGQHAMEWILPDLLDGDYYLEVSTTTQRTVRLFRLQRT